LGLGIVNLSESEIINNDASIISLDTNVGGKNKLKEKQIKES